MAFGDFFYHTLLKQGRIIVVVLGVIILVLVMTYAQKFGTGVENTAANAMTYCKEDLDCFEHCGKCVAIVSAEVCENNPSISCSCVENKCAIAQPF